jgi:hypothetical protein
MYSMSTSQEKICLSLVIELYMMFTYTYMYVLSS